MDIGLISDVNQSRLDNMWELENGEHICSITEFAEYMDVSTTSVYYWVARGMPLLKHPGKRRKMLVPFEMAETWVAENIDRSRRRYFGRKG